MHKPKISIIGCGNIGSAMAMGFIKSKKYLPNEINNEEIATMKKNNLYSLLIFDFIKPITAKINTIIPI